MTTRGVGLLLVLLCAVLIGAAAIFQNVRFDQSLAQDRVAAEQVSRRLSSAEVAIAELRGAEAGYLAAGQGLDFWMKRASSLSADIENSLSELQAATTSTDARPHYDAALALLGGLNSLDQKARDDIASGDRLLASDVIFMDLTESTQRLTDEIAAAREAEYAAGEVRIGALQRARFQLGAAAIGLLLAGMMLLVAVRRPQVMPAAVSPPAAGRLFEAPIPADSLDLGRPSRPIEISPVNLSDAAQVCVDMARVLDGQDVPPLLERAARILDAKGLVLWVADGSGALLRPSLAHGYSDGVLQRLGPLQADADNVTSLAFRSLQAQTFSNPSKGATNAIAVPLITSSGCIGVLSAEVTQPVGANERLAVARMFAAQLSTLVTPSTAETMKTAQA